MWHEGLSFNEYKAGYQKALLNSKGSGMVSGVDDEELWEEPHFPFGENKSKLPKKKLVLDTNNKVRIPKPQSTGFIIKKWLSHSGFYYQEDSKIYPTREEADKQIDHLQRMHGWQSPAPSYKVEEIST